MKAIKTSFVILLLAAGFIVVSPVFAQEKLFPPAPRSTGDSAQDLPYIIVAMQSVETWRASCAEWFPHLAPLLNMSYSQWNYKYRPFLDDMNHEWLLFLDKTNNAKPGFDSYSFFYAALKKRMEPVRADLVTPGQLSVNQKCVLFGSTLPNADEFNFERVYANHVAVVRGKVVAKDVDHAAATPREVVANGVDDVGNISIKYWPNTDQGIAVQYNRGLMYYFGKGAPKDHSEAVRWFLYAADQGHAESQYNLALMFDQGQGVPKSDNDAVKWYRLAAEQGHPNALHNLGIRYAKGQGVPKNIAAAYALSMLSKARDTLNNAAIKNRDALLKSMTTQEINIAQNLVRDLAKPGNFLKALDEYVESPRSR